MTKELRRLSIVMLAMFLALFASTSIIQVVQAGNLTNTTGNTRALYDSYEVQRGSIIASGTAIASSVPSDDVYSWQRQYTDAAMWAPVTGYMNPVLDAKTRIEATENGVLSGSDNADAEIARYQDILRQLDELELDFDRIRHIKEIVRGYRSRVEEMERELDRSGGGSSSRHRDGHHHSSRHGHRHHESSRRHRH